MKCTCTNMYYIYWDIDVCINILTLIGNTSLLYDIELFKYQRKNKTTNPTNFQSGDAAKVDGKNPRNFKFRQVTELEKIDCFASKVADPDLVESWFGYLKSHGSVSEK